MIKQKLSELVKANRTDQEIYHELMSFRVREILLVASIYDAFILEEEEMLTEKVFVEYYELNLSNAPRITSVPFGEEALDMLRHRTFDMVILTMRVDQMSPFELSRKIREVHPDIPVLLLLNDDTEIGLIERNRDKLRFFDKVFVWNADNKIFLAMIKYVEDKINVVKDTRVGLVRVILLVEDSIRYTCTYLPALYTEIMRQTQRVIADEHLDEMRKLLRMRTRPKVLTAESYEHAVRLVDRYRDHLLCVITDVSFTRYGKKDPEAGIELIDYCRSRVSFLPVLVQSADPGNREKAAGLHAAFMSKQSENISGDLRDFIYNHLGFGDFVFRDQEQPEITRARSMEEFKLALARVPESSLIYHSGRNHFSAWLMAHGEIRVAKSLQPVEISDFPSVEDFRRHMIGIIEQVQEGNVRGRVMPFDPSFLPLDSHVLRLTGGSLGGKGRGTAFLYMLSQIAGLEGMFSGVKTRIPRTAIIGTEEYDAFMERNGLTDLLLESKDPGRGFPGVVQRFWEGELSPQLRERLAVLLEHLRCPLTVRSSGMFEDSLSQPFSGIYHTYMLPNNHPDPQVRLAQVEQAVKLVYASVFSAAARAYFDAINYRTGEEKMGVVIQEVVGRAHGRYFYPDMAGTAQSYNYYPVSYLAPEDGIAVMGVGLGRHVIDGEKAHRFCPRYPRLDFLDPAEQLALSQSSFFALDLQRSQADLREGEQATLARLPLDAAENDPVFVHCVSTWDQTNDRLVPGTAKPGPRVVNFAPILKYGLFPLDRVLAELLDMGKSAMGTPVEIEFAVSLPEEPEVRPVFHVLQIKPLLGNLEEHRVDLEGMDRGEALLLTHRSVGNGLVEGLRDLVYVDLDRFDRSSTAGMAGELGRLNAGLKARERGYVLIGPGRWGSRDPWLGVPVDWSHISAARVIVEVDLPGLQVDPSLGSHFFHNITSMNIGYFHVSTGRPGKEDPGDVLDWEWLKRQQVVDRTEHFVHAVTRDPLEVRMDGRRSVAVIRKPAH
ncbi:MAG: PEP/pyruvate-binding domain-containing protein [Spirochaetota bacterium]